MNTFPKMVEILPEGTSGQVVVRHIEVTEQDSAFTRIRAIQHGRDAYVPAGRYAHLMVGHTLMMSDTPMEQRTNSGIVRQAHGHVLIAGLGLGMIPHPIAAKANVTEITVIEKYADVIRLVGPTLPAKVRVIEADIFTWKPEKGTRYDTLYWDIWPDITESNLDEMATLNRRFARCKAEDAWMGAWCQDELKAQRRRNRAQPQRRWSW